MLPIIPDPSLVTLFNQIPVFVIAPRSADGTIAASQQCHHVYPLARHSVDLYVPTAIDRDLRNRIKDNLVYGLNGLGPNDELTKYFRLWMTVQGQKIYRNVHVEAAVLSGREVKVAQERIDQGNERLAYEQERDDVSRGMLHSPVYREFSRSARLTRRLCTILDGAWKKTLQGVPAATIKEYVVGRVIVAERTFAGPKTEYDYEDRAPEVREFWAHFPRGWRYTYNEQSDIHGVAAESHPNPFVRRYTLRPRVAQPR